LCDLTIVGIDNQLKYTSLDRRRDYINCFFFFLTVEWNCQLLVKLIGHRAPTVSTRHIVIPYFIFHRVTAISFFIVSEASPDLGYGEMVGKWNNIKNNINLHRIQIQSVETFFHTLKFRKILHKNLCHLNVTLLKINHHNISFVIGRVVYYFFLHSMQSTCDMQKRQISNLFWSISLLI
jgi:hypothetical protein